MLGAQMEPQNRPSLQYAEAGGVLAGVLFACVLVGSLVGWLAGSAGIGILIGAVVGMPLSVYTVYRRYRDVF
jgi:F0F1-type ATP synthase assembly protein I